MFNMAKMMQQAKVMQDKMKALQEQLAQELVEGQAGSGAVTVVMTCKGECRKVDIADAAANGGDKEMLEDLILAAINDARAKADAHMAEETNKIMEELGLPAGAQLPF